MIENIPGLISLNLQLDGIFTSSNFNFKLSSFIAFIQNTFHAPAIHKDISPGSHYAKLFDFLQS